MIKVLLSLTLAIGAVSLASAKTSSDRFSKCVPPEVDLNSSVFVETGQSKRSRSTNRQTIKSRLAQLNAYCKKGKLFANGKQVYFYNMIGCWGNPPDNYLELLQEQTEEIRRLKKKYTVIQISCSGSSDPRLVS